MLLDHIIPKGSQVRRNFSFDTGDKSFVNILYRHFVDYWLKLRYFCTDYFYSITPINQTFRIKKIIQRSFSSSVELMVHPENMDEYNFLQSELYLKIINNVELGTHTTLTKL
jgi:hypothetical protein